MKLYSNSKKNFHSYELIAQITSRGNVPHGVVRLVAVILFSEESDILSFLKIEKSIILWIDSVQSFLYFSHRNVNTYSCVYSSV